MKEKKALIVDDDKLMRTLIGSFLEKEGWSFISLEKISEREKNRESS